MGVGRLWENTMPGSVCVPSGGDNSRELVLGETG